MLPSSSLLANKTISAACFQASRVALRQMLLAGQPNDAALLGVPVCVCVGWVAAQDFYGCPQRWARSLRRLRVDSVSISISISSSALTLFRLLARPGTGPHCRRLNLPS